jgi:transketolase
VVEFIPKNMKQWSRLGPRAMYGQFMLELAEYVPNLMVISADLGRSSGLDRFKKKYPEKYLSVGISEQNMIGIAAGLAYEGYKVFVTSFAPFLSMRASEHIRMNLGYMQHPVNLVALGSGLAMGYLGNSHFGLEDISYMRSIPNMNISCPADCSELAKILLDYSQHNRGPSYTRLTGVPGSISFYEDDYNYEFSKKVIVGDGNDILIISHGAVAAQCKLAHNIIKESGIESKLVNVHTIKPLDPTLIDELKNYNKIVIVEEHSIIGGLTSIISEIIASNDLKRQILSVSLPDKFGPTGDYNFLLKIYNLSAEQIAKKIINYLK